MSKKVIGWKEISDSLSEKATEALSELKPGQVLAVAVKHINDSEGKDKYQIEFAEKIARPEDGDGISALSIFNADDERFTSGARRVWVSITATQCEKLFGFTLDNDVSHKEILTVLSDYEEGKQEYRIKIREVIEADLPENEIDYKDLRLKRRSKDGPVFFTNKGEKVYSLTELRIYQKGAEVPHVYLEGSYMSAEQMLKEEMDGNDVNKKLAQEQGKSSVGRF